MSRLDPILKDIFTPELLSHAMPHHLEHLKNLITSNPNDYESLRGEEL